MFFFAGVVAHQNRLDPWNLSFRIYNKIFKQKQLTPSELQVDFLERLFIHPLIEKKLLNNETTKNFYDLETQVEKLKIFPYWFKSKKNYPKLISTKFSGNKYLVTYKIKRTHESWSYFIQSKSNNADCAFLVIPGSGHNQAHEMFIKNKENYQMNIIPFAEQNCDVYILNKPNQGFLAIHHKNKKLSYDGLIVYLLNQGGSYSAKYLADSVALGSDLKTKYSKLIISGLSQGGNASLFTSLIVDPQIAIVASGYSTTNDAFEWANLEQMLAPGIGNFFNKNQIFKKIEVSENKYIFTYGKKEMQTYGLEAANRSTCNFFGKLRNFYCIIHDQGHSYPIKELDDILRF